MPEQELTVLFYFASDNPLAPLVISEIKAIKDAGYEKNTNVLVYFDPMEKNAPPQLFDVNRKRKLERETLIGDDADPFVRNMSEDEVELRELTPAMSAAATAKEETKAFDSLKNFVERDRFLQGLISKLPGLVTFGLNLNCKRR